MGHQQSPEPAAFLNSLVDYKIYLSITIEKKNETMLCATYKNAYICTPPPLSVPEIN